MPTISPYLNSLPGWIPLLKGKHLLLDSDALISIIEFDAKDLLDELKKLDVTFCIIHPVYVELLQTNNTSKRLERQTLLDEYQFHVFPLTKNEMDKAKLIQTYLILSKSFTASPTDLYLGGRLSTIKTKNIFLLTSNLSDFPYPLYIRETGIVLQNNKSSKTLFILSIDNDELLINEDVVNQS